MDHQRIGVDLMGAIQQALLGVGGAAAAWRTAFDWTASVVGNNTGWNTYTMRYVINTTALAGSGSKVKITLKGGSTVGIVVDKCYVQIAAASGDAYDFDTTPVAVLFGGSASVSMAAGVNTTSDEVTLAFDGTRKLVISVHFSGSSNLRTFEGEPGSAYVTGNYVAGDSAATVNASTGQASTVARAISKLEIYG